MHRIPTFINTYSFHSNPIIRSVITLFYAGVGVRINFYCLQIFCVPVQWASIYCLCSFATILLFPFIKNRVLQHIFYFLLGAASLPCVYCIIFLADPWGYFTGYIFFTLQILLFGIGLMAFLPVYLFWHICKYFKTGNQRQKFFFTIGASIPLVILTVYLIQFRKDYTVLDIAYKADTVSQIEQTHVHEQLLGIGYKYHTKLEYTFDGWRPPLHNPFLNIGLWLFSDCYFPFRQQTYPFTQLDRPRYYKLLFPENSLIVDCPCSHTKDGMSYFNDTASFR